MKKDINNPVVLDAGVLIALAVGESSAAKISNQILDQRGSYACTELALCELSYILCRHSSWAKSQEKTQNLLLSSALTIIPSHVIWIEASKIKCNVPIALPDCFSIAAARIVKGVVVFARKEKELIDAIEKKLLDDPIEFLG